MDCIPILQVTKESHSNVATSHKNHSCVEDTIEALEVVWSDHLPLKRENLFAREIGITDLGVQ